MIKYFLRQYYLVLIFKFVFTADMVIQIKPVKKESYFTYVDCIISAPTQDKLILSTNFCKKYLLDVKTGILSCGVPSCQVPGIKDQRVYKYSEHRGAYALATNSGVSICNWDNIVSSPGSVGSDTSFYSVDWIGDNVIAGKNMKFVCTLNNCCVLKILIVVLCTNSLQIRLSM
jgi:hypothetical protein